MGTAVLDKMPRDSLPEEVITGLKRMRKLATGSMGEHGQAEGTVLRRASRWESACKWPRRVTAESSRDQIMEG